MLVGCAWFAGSVAAAELLLEVIELRHRLVRDMIPTLQPLLAEGGTLTGTSNQLIVRTTRENLAEIRDVVTNLDTRVRQLKITVTQDLNAVANLSRDALSGHLKTDDFGAAIGADDPHGGVRYDGTRTRSEGDESQLHTVVGMEGAPAYIATGHEFPYPYYRETHTPYGAQVSTGIAYQQLSSGLYVTPHLQGDRVVLDIAPQLERTDAYGSGTIESHGAATTVGGRLGEWIEIGGTHTASGGIDTELLARTRRQGDNSYTVWVKVEALP
ncbi:MAG: secretin N-terminal domain-containing protein [Gammaproteobacteria bacterium]